MASWATDIPRQWASDLPHPVAIERQARETISKGADGDTERLAAAYRVVQRNNAARARRAATPGTPASPGFSVRV